MTGSDDDPRTLVMRDVRDKDGLSWRAVTETADGGLQITGHDLGPGVSNIFGGSSEYEFERRLSPEATAALRELLGVAPDGDLLVAIEDRFDSTTDLEAFIAAHEIPSEFWSRIGD